MVAIHAAEEEIVDQPGPLAQKPETFGVLGSAFVTEGRFDVDEGGIANHVCHGPLGLYYATDQLFREKYEASVSFQGGGPATVFAAVHGVQERLVHRGVEAHRCAIACSEARGVLGDAVWIVGVGKFGLQPERASIVHEVYDRDEFQGVQVFDHPISPRPVPFVWGGVYAVPGDAVPDHGDSRGGREVEVFAPPVVVACQLVFVQGSEARSDLRDEGVLDAYGELQAVGFFPETVHYGRYTRK